VLLVVEMVLDKQVEFEGIVTVERKRRLMLLKMS